MRERLGDLWRPDVDFNPPDDDAFARLNLQVYRAAQAETGAQVILDKSKKLGRARRLAQTEGIELTMLHIVRDPRAVANSFRNQGLRKGRERKLRFNYYKNVARWTVLNALMSVGKLRKGAYVRVHYEELVRDPRAALTPALDAVGLSWDPAMDTFRNGEAAHARRQPDAALGVREIRPDTKYLHEVSAVEWVVGTAVALPTFWRTATASRAAARHVRHSIRQRRHERATADAIPLRLVGVGPQRTGSTWLDVQLRRHPELALPAHVKETFFFDRHWSRGLDDYRAHFASGGPDALAPEAGPRWGRPTSTPPRCPRASQPSRQRCAL